MEFIQDVDVFLRLRNVDMFVDSITCCQIHENVHIFLNTILNGEDKYHKHRTIP